MRKCPHCDKSPIVVHKHITRITNDGASLPKFPKNLVGKYMSLSTCCNLPIVASYEDILNFVK